MTALTKWIPVQYDPTTTSRANQASAILALANPVNMTTETAYFRRVGGNEVNIGKTYSDDTSDHDKILLTAKKFQGQNKLDEDDFDDANDWGPVIQPLANEWLISFAVKFDNSCLGVTASPNGDVVPFESVYYKVTNNGTANSSEAGYVANSNLTQSATAGDVTYNDLSKTLALVEGGEYWDDTNALVIAHPAFREVFRNIKDNNDRPIFVAGQGGDSGTPDQLFGVDVHWSRGAKTSAQATRSPEGNPLLVFVGNRMALIRGDRDPIESRMAVSDALDSTDEVGVKFRTRRAFAVSNIKGVSVLEKRN